MSDGSSVLEEVPLLHRALLSCFTTSPTATLPSRARQVAASVIPTTHQLGSWTATAWPPAGWVGLWNLIVP